MRKNITFIEVIIVIVMIVVVVKGYRFWNKPEEVSIEEPAQNEVTSPHITPEMVLIKGGTFQMGDLSIHGACEPCNPILPLHEVTITKDFYMSKYEVTNSEYVKFLNDVGNQAGPEGWPYINMDEDSRHSGIEFIIAPTGDSKDFPFEHRAPNTGNFKVKSGYENRPVVFLIWYGAVAYCNWLSEQEGFAPVYGADPDSEDPANWLTKNGYRLPTEAEWEYACRAGTNTNFYWGDEMDEDYCWCATHSGQNLHEVGQKKPKSYGLYDMSGNVYEWCSDWYDEDYYEISPSNNPVGPASGSRRATRGGDWCSGGCNCESGFRTDISPDSALVVLGFRLCRSVP